MPSYSISQASPSSLLPLDTCRLIAWDRLSRIGKSNGFFFFFWRGWGEAVSWKYCAITCVMVLAFLPSLTTILLSIFIWEMTSWEKTQISQVPLRILIWTVIYFRQQGFTALSSSSPLKARPEAVVRIVRKWSWLTHLSKECSWEWGRKTEEEGSRVTCTWRLWTGLHQRCY